MNYEIVNLKEKTVVGVTARTANDAPDCAAVIGGLWKSYFGDGILASIKNKATPYCIGLYSDYDATSYDVTVGSEVSTNANPELSVKTIPAGKYAVFNIKGNVVTDVANAWNEIWQMPLDRSFAADFEEYLTNDEDNAEINIYIALK